MYSNISAENQCTKDTTSSHSLTEVYKRDNRCINYKMEWNKHTEGLTNEQSFSSILEKVATQIKENQNRTGDNGDDPTLLLFCLL